MTEQQREVRLYTERDIMEQGEYYTRHVMAMTAERLHDKSSIAAELAHRDGLIDELQGEVKRLLAEAEDADRILRSSVPERHKGATSPIGAVQNYIAELEAAPQVAVPEQRDDMIPEHFNVDECRGFRTGYNYLRDLLAAAPTAPAGQQTDPTLREASQFLMDRLEEFAPDNLDDNNARDWFGHIEPAIGRLRMAVESGPAGDIPQVTAYDHTIPVRTTSSDDEQPVSDPDGLAAAERPGALMEAAGLLKIARSKMGADDDECESDEEATRWRRMAAVEQELRELVKNSAPAPDERDQRIAELEDTLARIEARDFEALEAAQERIADLEAGADEREIAARALEELASELEAMEDPFHHTLSGLEEAGRSALGKAARLRAGKEGEPS